MFKYYVKIRNVVDFKSLVDLMISDKFLDTLEPETASHIKIMQADQWMTPDELGKAVGKKKKILAAVCRIEAAILLPSKVFEFLKSGSGEAGSTNASCKPVCLRNETGGENDVDLTGSVTNSGKITDGSNLFLLKVSETFDECLYDVSHISNSGIRDKVQTLIENYCPNKTETTALKMKIILSDEKPIAQRSRRLSLPEKREVEKQIDEWLEQGIIRESCSDFSSPVVVCKKKRWNNAIVYRLQKIKQENS
ncbi:peptidase A2 domain-containing protein [Trichonephila clavipes]|nr:peptidase A2 domain-containing protein [Trichonephila clavipes]